MAHTVETTKIRGRIRARAKERLESTRLTLAEFQTKFQESPLEALTWRTEDVVRDQTLGELASHVLGLTNSEASNEEVFAEVLAFFDRMQGRVMQLARGLSTSTNAVDNEIRRVQARTMADAVHFGGWLFEVAGQAQDVLKEVEEAAVDKAAAEVAALK
jgi:hypothetical protein